MKILSPLILIVVVVCAGCTSRDSTDSQANAKARGAAVGAAVGAAAGALSALDEDADERRKRALIGLGVGALAGLSVGAYMDKQEARLREDLSGTGVSVERRGDDLILNMPGHVTFDVGQSVVQDAFYPTLASVVATLQGYPQTTVDIIGHTDSTGNAQNNQQLSEDRADAVGQHLRDEGVEPLRIATYGLGASTPIADNATVEGRRQNRRVEMRLRPLQEDQP